ncbi:hypothetical protein BTUL_0014g00940 [Botrytis tulipae]|uniref:Uncharacterized protein n=1 Tax=Botrytis tulipae TaxID=87230 RepID=A0A4Z1F356_9HELO|nr:hypothetical protein BTUL_0014g00940 [Botrytis tulipae]
MSTITPYKPSTVTGRIITAGLDCDSDSALCYYLVHSFIPENRNSQAFCALDQHRFDFFDGRRAECQKWPRKAVFPTVELKFVGIEHDANEVTTKMEYRSLPDRRRLILTIK